MKDYHHRQGVSYERPPGRGFDTLAVLQFLRGKKWDALALAYVHSLRPSSIRVSKGEMTLDGMLWRVTVRVSDDDEILNITQEVEVGLTEPLSSAVHLRAALKHGLDAPEAKFYEEDPNDPTEIYSYGLDGEVKKHLKSGKTQVLRGSNHV